MMLAFSLALSSVRLVESRERVRLTSLDPYASLFGGTVVAVAFAVVLAAARSSLWWLCTVPLVFGGFRVRVVVGPDEYAVVQRHVFGFIWRSRCEGAYAIELVCSGWGDWSDPEELSVSIGDQMIPLGWTTRGSGERAQDLAKSFNDRVSQLRNKSHIP